MNENSSSQNRKYFRSLILRIRNPDFTAYAPCVEGGDSGGESVAVVIAVVVVLLCGVLLVQHRSPMLT